VNPNATTILPASRIPQVEILVAEYSGEDVASPSGRSPIPSVVASIPPLISLNETYLNSEIPGLHGDRIPSGVRVREMPEHRTMVLLKAQGLSNRAIAKTLGVCVTTVGVALRQPWCRELLLKEIHAAGRPAIEMILAGTVEDSIYRLIEERDSSSNRSADRITAADKLLDRVLGKPTQKIEQYDAGKLQPKDKVEDLQKQIEELEAETKSLLGTSTSTATGGQA
jgi:hypothetical protein